MSNEKKYILQSCDLIREGCPCEPEPPLKNWPGKPWLEWKEEPRIEAGFSYGLLVIVSLYT